jgi:hypothetical protein
MLSSAEPAPAPAAPSESPDASPVAAEAIGGRTSAPAPGFEDDDLGLLEPYEAQEVDYEMKVKSQRLRRYDVKRILDGQDGYLKKRTKQMGGMVWNSRWFSLQGPRLLYYKTAPGKFATAHENPPHAFISLQYVLRALFFKTQTIIPGY